MPIAPSARSPASRIELRRSRIAAGIGGCDFLADPDRTALEEPVFWRADALARHVRLTSAPDVLAADTLVRFEPERWGGRSVGRPTPDGYHLIVMPVPGIAHHLFFTGTDPPALGTSLAPMPSFDPWHPERLDATLAFWRLAQNPRVSAAARIRRPKPTPRSLEAAFMLWALDLRREGASLRDIGAAVVGRMAINWEDNGTRSWVRRFVTNAQIMAARKYRKFLKPPRHHR